MKKIKILLIVILVFILNTGCVKKISEARFEYNFKKTVQKRLGRINYLGSKKESDYFYFVMSAFGTEKVKINSKNLKIEKRFPYSFRNSKHNDIRELNISYNDLKSNANK